MPKKKKQVDVHVNSFAVDVANATPGLVEGGYTKNVLFNQNHCYYLFRGLTTDLILYFIYPKSNLLEMLGKKIRLPIGKQTF